MQPQADNAACEPEKRSLVDELLAERKAEAERENQDAASSYYFGSGTRRHEVSHLTDNWATMWCGIGGRTSGPAVKVRSSRVEPNCRACARAKARNLANA